MNVYASIDNIGYDSKPSKKIGEIKRRTCNNWNIHDIRIIADLVGNKGHAMVPGHLDGGIKESNFKGIQLFGLDFDNGVSFYEVKEFCDNNNIPIAFAYRTYSSTENHEKFRVVFAYECLIEDIFVARVIMAMLHKIFSDCDQQCKNLDRMFYGGKKLIHINESARVALVHLLYPFLHELKKAGHYKRNLQSFCRKNDICMRNDVPMIVPSKYLSDFGEFSDTAIIYTIGGSFFSPFSIAQGYKMKHQGKTCSRKLCSIEIKNNNECKLFSDFLSGEDVGHHAKFAIITNLIYIKGGYQLFFNVLKESDYDSYLKWKTASEYIKGYKPTRCSDAFCPYYESCNDSGTILETIKRDRKIRIKEEKYYSLEEAREQMADNLQRAFLDSSKGIHLIKAQTAIGKTTAYKELICNNSSSKFVIALPTNILRNEVKESLSSIIGEGNIYSTPTLQDNPLIPEEIRNQIKDYHNQGVHNKTGPIIKELLQEVESDPAKCLVAKECKKIIEGNKDVKERVILTTHAYLKLLDDSVLQDRTIIIDEDILQMNFFSKICEVSVDTLKSIVSSNVVNYSEKAREMLSGEVNKVIFTEPIEGADNYADKVIEKIDLYMNDNAGDIVNAVNFIKCEDFNTGKDVVRYFCAPKLDNHKYIIMSATLNEEIYKKYFDMRVFTYPEKKAIYVGELIQYTYHSLGRTFLKAHMKEVFSFACEAAEDCDVPIITFKAIKEEEELAGYNFTDLHFGNTSGIDKYKGENLCIVGTFYKRGEEYKLIAAYLGADVNRSEDENPKFRRVEYDNKSFLITTYKEPLLQEIQLYQIHSEMEQAVGRARLLRNDCTVYLFSSFPCNQANIDVRNYI